MFSRIFYTIICLFVSLSFAEQPTQVNYKEDEVFIRFAPKEKGQPRTLSEKQSFLNFTLDNAQIKKQYSRIPGLTLVKLPANIIRVC